MQITLGCACYLRVILSFIDYSGGSNSRGAMEDMAEKTHKGLPAELDPDHTGVRKRFVTCYDREHVCLFWQDDRYFNYTLPYKFMFIL
jgi:hypothetical protein